jgi:hypothetical protein
MLTETWAGAVLLQAKSRPTAKVVNPAYFNIFICHLTEAWMSTSARWLSQWLCQLPMGRILFRLLTPGSLGGFLSMLQIGYAANGTLIRLVTAILLVTLQLTLASSLIKLKDSSSHCYATVVRSVAQSVERS